MVADQAAHARDTEEPVEEIYYRKGDIDFCFLLNRRHHNLRVFDYRVGNYQQKRDFFDRIARTEGLRKVFTVVEKQDSKSWRSVGFSREGAIPGYFRTADAYIMSRVYTDDGEPIQGGAPKLVAPTAHSKEKAPAKPRGMTSEVVSDVRRLQSVASSLSESSMYAPFRRGTFHPDLGLLAKMGKKEYWVGAETDSSFGHAKIDMLTPPDKDVDVSVLAFCVRALLDELLKLETASVFSLCAVDSPLSNQVYAELGFKVTARLTDHVTRDEEFIGAQLWHRRLANTPTPRLPSFI
ncbi:MAG: hypothetical protein K1X88_22965 [Nannocystaceae bacterium]|nr:hypothetical protein [Nannocystaceae bacterium]